MKKLTKRFKKNEGFTLMEIIIVIVILGILALIAVPRLIGFTTQAEIASDREYAAVTARAAELYWAANNKTTPTVGNLVDTGMIDSTENGLQHYDTANITMGAEDTPSEGVAQVELSDPPVGSGSPNVIYNSLDGYDAGLTGATFEAE
jgi:prepilin-type N-terminal cleavage/methylation domain-containing protein